MLHLSKFKPRYYITREHLYQITENQLEYLGLTSDIFSSRTLKEPHCIFLAAECYEIFINSAEQLYSKENFVKQNRNNFIFNFPHLEVENYTFFFDQPQFDLPYLGIAIDRIWLDSLTKNLNDCKFYSTQIQPLATYLLNNNPEQYSVFTCIEPSTETTFIQVDSVLDMILRKQVSTAIEVVIQTWGNFK